MGEPMTNAMDGLQAEVTCGSCPLQIEGTIDGEPFYFRARDRQWYMGLGGDPINEPAWQMGGPWGDGPTAAGWMPVETGRAIVEECCRVWRAVVRDQRRDLQPAH